MIFNAIFKKGDDKTKGQDGTSDAGMQKTAPKKIKKGKLDSKVLEKELKTHRHSGTTSRKNKRNSNKIVHTRRSFHPPKRKASKEQVNIHDIIERPVVTEKAANESENRVYTFFVRETANKHRVSEAVEALYGVKPKKVRIARRPSKRKRVRIPGRERDFGMTTAKKKAYVFLREGDTIKLT